MHDIATGFFTPNAADIEGNILADFGTTINIINGSLECGPSNKDEKA